MIFNSLKYDVYCLSETHLTGDNELQVDDYTWFGNNRTKIHARARKGSGGVGVLVRNELLKCFRAEVVNKSVEGVIILQLQHMITDHSVAIIVTYVPPENSSRGRQSNVIFSHLVSQLYLLSEECDTLIMGGDCNARIGQMNDCISDVDVLPVREVIDHDKNSQGEEFIDFLHDVKCCVLNGRFSTGKNNFMCISGNGRSVVDYIAVPHYCIDSCSDFTVHTVTELIDKFGLHALIGPRCKPPDHSLLVTTLSLLTPTY